MTLTINTFRLFILVFPLFFYFNSNSQVTLAAWEVNGQTNFGPSPFAATTKNSNLTVGGLTRGPGASTSRPSTAAANAWGCTGTNESSAANAITGGDFVYFTIEANYGFQVSLTEIPVYNIRRSAQGSTTGQWQYSINGGAYTNIGSAITWGGTTTAAGNTQSAITLSGIGALQNVTGGNVIIIRLVLWGSSNPSQGRWYINNITGNDLSVTGTVTASTANTITLGTLSGAPFTFSTCNSTVTGSMTYTISGTFNAGNQFIAQVSNNQGLFFEAVNIGTNTSTASGTVNFTFPINIQGGTGYKIRIISTNPPATSDYSADFTITQNGSYCAKPGDYQTRNSGDWNSNANWQVYSYSFATKSRGWVDCTAGDFPRFAAYSAFIRNGHTITYNTTNNSIYHLVVDAGGKLYRNSSTNANHNFINLGGDILNNGTIGNGATSDAISFNIQALNHTIAGSGVFDCWRIRLSDEVTNGASVGNATLNLGMNINLRWVEVATFGKNALYNNTVSEDSTIFNINILAGFAVNIVSATAGVGIDGAILTNSTYAANERSGTITVFGTLSCAGRTMLGSNNAVYKPSIVVKNGGRLQTGFLDYGDNNNANGGTLTIEDGGTLEINSVSTGSTTWLNTATGTINFSVQSGSTVEYSLNGSQTIPVLFNYHHLTLRGGGTKIISNATHTVNGNLIFNNVGIECVGASSAITSAGNVTLTGTITYFGANRLIFTTSGNSTQTITTGANNFNVSSFSSTKTAGGIVFANSNALLLATGTLTINYSGSAVFNDGGNQLTFGDNLVLTGAGANYNLTGTLRLLASSGDNDFEQIAIPLNNLTIETSGTSRPRFRNDGTYTQNINILGNLNIANTSSNSVMLNDVVFTLKGNLTNSTNIANYNTGTSAMIIDGTANQSITGLNEFYDLRINKSSGEFTLNNNARITNQLRMLSGDITTGSNEIEIGASTANKGTLDYTEGFIIGTVKRWFSGTNSGNASGLFPIGQNNEMKFVRIEFTGTPSAGGTLTISLNNSDMGNNGLPVSVAATGSCTAFNITTTSKQAYWEINDGNGLTGGTYNMRIEAEGFNTITNICQLGILKRSGSGPWSLAGTHIEPSGTTAKPIIEISGGSGWSNFGLGGGTLNPLPVSLSFFNANQIDNKPIVKLNWTTVSEINNDYFEIERSIRLTDWVTIGKIKGVGNSFEVNEYIFNDSNLTSGHFVFYYRLKQVDFDGNFEYSPNVEVIIQASNANKISVYPNPVIDSKLFVEFKYPINASFKIVDLTGRQVLGDLHFNQVNKTLVSADLSLLPKGVYFLKIEKSEAVEITKLIVD